MTIKNKGERNLKIAEILDSQDFLALSQFNKMHLCSVIINRLYYAVYLLGKDKLIAKNPSFKEDDFLGHGTERDVENIKHSSRRQKKLWVELDNAYNSNEVHRLCLLAAKLHEMRNFYDYRSDREQEKALKDLDSCKEQTRFLAEKIGGLE